MRPIPWQQKPGHQVSSPSATDGRQLNRFCSPENLLWKMCNSPHPENRGFGSEAGRIWYFKSARSQQIQHLLALTKGAGLLKSEAENQTTPCQFALKRGWMDGADFWTLAREKNDLKMKRS